MTDLALILGAVLLAAAGGEAFLKSILGAALHLRVPKMAFSNALRQTNFYTSCLTKVCLDRHTTSHA